jgi:hypothetical protein
LNATREQHEDLLREREDASHGARMVTVATMTMTMAMIAH